MRHGRGQAEMIKACAVAFQVTEQAVRKWRSINDKRWLNFLAERAISAGSQPSTENNLSENNNETDIDIKDIAGEGLKFEILRARKECLDYARRVRNAQKNGDIDTEVTLSRILDQKRETLRRLEKDTPSIDRESGETVDRIQTEAEFTSLLTSLKLQLEQLPLRIASILPAGIMSDVKPKIEAEINSLFTRLSEAKINA